MCKSSANVDGTRNFAIKLFGATISVSVCDDFSQEESSSRKRPAPAEEASKIESLCERGAKSLKIIENLEETASKIENLSHGGPKSLKMNENIEEKGSKVESLSGRGAKSLKMTESIEEKSEISCSIDKGEESLKSVTAGDVKSLPKPEKPVPCPRCHSVETKFCYFNNYNVNQPRHFCKNCRRYWTAGGSMRNIPVGAGRRKSKHFSTFQLSKSMDLQESKVKYENFDESIHQTPGIFSTGDESVVSKNPCVEEIEGSNSVGFMNPMVAAGFANLMDPASTIDGIGTENSTPWIQKLQQSGNSNNILNCLVLHGRPLSTKLHTK